MGGLFRAGLGIALLIIAGCAERVYAPQEAVEAARHISAEAPYVSLLTMVANNGDRGAHSAILVNGSQVALYDPAGTYRHPSTPERGDVFYGITPIMKEVYKRFHARDSHYVVEQKLPVSRAMADAVLARIEAQGPSSKLYCAVNVAQVLRDFDQFSHVPQSFYPGKIMEAFGAVPGVQTSRFEENDRGKNVDMRLIKDAR